MSVEGSETLSSDSSSKKSDAQLAQPFLLRQARERVGMHLAAVAVMLKVPVARLEALEAGRYHELPDPTFVRALAKSVCKVLKVDPEPILASLPAAYVADLGPTPTAISEPMPLSRAGKMMSPSESMVRIPSAVLIAAGLSLFAVALWLWLPERVVEQPVDHSTAQSSTMPVIETETAAVSQAEPAPINGPKLLDGVVQILALDTSWIEVTGASGRVLMQRSLEPQESVAFSSDLPLSMVIGRADQVNVFVRGETMDLQPWTRANVARFEVR